jgi:hypothetical protein
MRTPIAGTHAVSNAVPLTIIDNQEKFKPSQESPRHFTQDPQSMYQTFPPFLLVGGF